MRILINIKNKIRNRLRAWIVRGKIAQIEDLADNLDNMILDGHFDGRTKEAFTDWINSSFVLIEVMKKTINE